jgi:flagellar protein FlbT
MNISLKRGEKIFLNGAVIRVDRKVSIELMNDVCFLLENHIIQPDKANSPLKQLYVAIQTILMTPRDSSKSLFVSLEMIRNFLLITKDKEIIDCLIEVKDHLEANKPFDALKSLRFILLNNSDIANKYNYKLNSHNI